jgi:putative phosphoesterase
LSFCHILLYFIDKYAEYPYFKEYVSMVTLGVISDTHLKAVSSELVDIYENYLSDVEMILHAGDLVSLEIADYLSQKPLHVVQGNMDAMDVRERFPTKTIIEIHGFRLGLIHGWGSPLGIERRIRSEFNDVHAIIYGHSHRPSNHADEGILFFNPGTATGFRIAGSNSIGILDIANAIKGTIIPV